ncbi:hypothetical protein [Dietzia psychralcaliphila]|uniref:hypothetical protein n=1 Tax=Dietzia psychralcaliphila TaxID=139021 RepID=UPI001C1E5385|nr:hypothetical protein [Dietzia psychralcaliphila]
MAEALGEEPEVVNNAVAAADAAGPNFTSQCAAIRKVVPWSRIEELIADRSSEKPPGFGPLRRFFRTSNN